MFSLSRLFVYVIVVLLQETTWLFLGASNAYNRKTWEWHNPLKPMTFQFWQSGEPNNPTDNNCMLYWKSGEGYKWGDESCVDPPRGFICQRDLPSSDDKTKSGSDGCIS